MILKGIKMIPLKDFKIVMNNAPLITIDFICKDKNNKILLGKRVNNPAKDFYFTPGGRIFKNEKIEIAIKRLSLKELGCEIELKDLKFNGIYEHMFDDSIFEDVSTHCINLAFEYSFETFNSLPNFEHEDYKMFTENEIMINKKVHDYVRDFFKKEKGIK